MFKLLFAKIILFAIICGQSLFAQNIAEKQVDSIFTGMIKFAEKLDYDELAKGVDDRYHTGFISGNSYYNKFDDLLTNAKSMSNSVAAQRISLNEKKITSISDDVVLVSASGEAQVEISSGNTFSLKFFWTFVYKRINNEWKVIQSHQSSIR